MWNILPSNNGNKFQLSTDIIEGEQDGFSVRQQICISISNTIHQVLRQYRVSFQELDLSADKWNNINVD